jgi:aspartyl-tRNA(Asn)/glutamyl-tRNA(Gln) amidotransferase subunit C
VYHGCLLPGLTSHLAHVRTRQDSFVSLSKDQVQHIALLARLELGEGEFDDVVDKLSRIVDFVDQLQGAQTDDVVPMAHPLDRWQRLRPDVVTEHIDRDAIQANAPAVKSGFYLVPKVLG